MLWPPMRVRPFPLRARRESNLLCSLSDKQRVRAAREMRSKGVFGGTGKREEGRMQRGQGR